MKQNLGLVVLLTASLAFFGISNLPRSATGGGSATEPSKESKSQPKTDATAAPALSPACEEIEDRLRPFLAEQRKISGKDTRQEGAYPGVCYDPGKEPAHPPSSSLSPNVQFVIATLPNPISTHLPWDEAKNCSSRNDQLLAEAAQRRQQAQPGVLMFRRAVDERIVDPELAPYRSGLVVFVVDEQPTRGIDRDEFENALAWIKSLGGMSEGRGLKILGPSFSGSLPSLDQALDSSDILKRPKGSPQVRIDVSSGTVSSERSYFWFKGRFKDKPSVTFQTATEGDSLMLDRFLQYLDSQHYPLACVAIVSEDETAFGDTAFRHAGKEGKPDNNSRCGQKAGAPKHPIYLYYPRDIAALRSAYERQAIFGTGNQQSNASSSSTTLRGDLSEPNNSNHDTVRSYGGQLTPLGQETVLLDIADILKEKRIQFVVLRSTNSLDQIFLAQFLRRAYAGARIVIDNADLLFPRGAEGTSLRGVMTLSTYPLLTWQQDWTPSLLHARNGAYRIFGERSVEGMYIAARELFLDRKVPSDVPIFNYAIPSWALLPKDTTGAALPATWLSVIGHHRFWPIAVLHRPVPDSSARELLRPAADRGDPRVAADDTDAHPLRLTFELIVLLILCSVWAALHCIWCWRGSVKPFPSLFRLAHFAPLNKNQHPALIAFGSVLLAAAALVTAAACGLFDGSLDGWRAGVLWAWGGLMILASCLACGRNLTLPGVSGNTPKRWRIRAVVIAGLALGLFTWRLFALVRLLTEENRIPAYWRSAHLLSGVSALLPQLLLIAGMYVWFWFCLRGLALFGEDRPLLPKRESLPYLDPEKTLPMMPMFSREEAARRVETSAMPVGERYLILLIIALVTAGSVSGLTLGDYSLRTLGEREFGIMMFAWLGLCIAMILADTAQLWTTWRQLRPLLVYLDRLPLRRTLASLRGLSWGSAWSVGGTTLEERYRMTSRQFESLKHLRNRIHQRFPEISAGELQALTAIDECSEKGREFARWYLQPHNSFNNTVYLQNLQEELAATAASVITHVLLPAWERETDSLILDTRTAGSQEPDATNRAASVRVPPHVQAAEEFFLLPYLAFIQNVLGRMRTLILSSISLFVAATLAVSSYPFDPLPVLGGIFLSVFAITGATVIFIFVHMHRDATLSHITNTRPGELGGQFWVHVITFGVAPLMGLLTTLFPSVTDFVTSWLMPGVQALK